PLWTSQAALECFHPLLQDSCPRPFSSEQDLDTGVSNGCVSKILARYYRTGTVGPKGAGGSKPRTATPAVVATIARLKLEQPGLFAWQIRRQLHAEGICASSRIPSVSPESPGIHRVRLHFCLSVPAVSPAAAAPLPQPPPAPGSLQPPRHRSGGRNRTVFSRQQAEALEKEFQRGQYPDPATRQSLAAATQLPDSTIRVRGPRTSRGPRQPGQAAGEEGQLRGQHREPGGGSKPGLGTGSGCGSDCPGLGLSLAPGGSPWHTRDIARHTPWHTPWDSGHTPGTLHGTLHGSLAQWGSRRTKALPVPVSVAVPGVGEPLILPMLGIKSLPLPRSKPFPSSNHSQIQTLSIL
uniref:Paired box 4 n=1 Tax=Catharus ustulatus TaxID=91951 RepID=A0A8C3UXA3_CATUS